LFIEANVEQIRAGMSQFPEGARTSARLVFTAHSIPESMAANSDYETQLKRQALIAAELNVKSWQVVYQSRSGSRLQPWLDPTFVNI